ncbi:Di-copper centre-containing protein [Hypoxylon sp. FL1857]|nr:Di-copper centre-containing protein [Hypoxylon sp. FL1857]
MSIVGRRLIPWAACVAAAVLTPQPQLDVQAQQPIPVTGMTTGINNRTGERPARWEVSALQAEGGPQWDLYIQALAALQNKTETDELSHFRISGIHGMPYAPFNGVGPVSGGSGGGFCPHGETQFVAWHRPYVALYEQALGSEVQRIASEYGGHQNASAYRDAAQVFRLPYWDWASNPELPHSCAQENITINGPRGSVTLHNPLYSYRWQTYPLNQSQFPGYQDFPAETTRASDGKSNFNPDVVNANLALVADQLKDLVYRTFTYAKSFDQMSSVADPAGVSFEAPHNIIHNAVGGSFASVDITAFDSLFMLHHANLDRLVALWMAVNFNDTSQSQPYVSSGLYATARGERITAASPLKPFFRADGQTFHTGLSAATLEPFGYTYLELREWDRGRGKQEVVSRINGLYGPANDKGDEDLLAEQWSVRITVNRSELELPCNIDVYVADAFGGRMALLGMPMHGIAHAEIPLQKIVSGATVNAKDMASLGLHLVATDVTHRSSLSEFPKYGNRSVYAKVALNGMLSDGG